MADVGVPTLPAPPAPQAPQPSVPHQPAQLPVLSNQPIPTQPIQYMPQLRWSHFKPDFSGNQRKM